MGGAEKLGSGHVSGVGHRTKMNLGILNEELSLLKQAGCTVGPESYYEVYRCLSAMQVPLAVLQMWTAMEEAGVVWDRRHALLAFRTVSRKADLESFCWLWRRLVYNELYPCVECHLLAAQCLWRAGQTRRAASALLSAFRLRSLPPPRFWSVAAEMSGSNSAAAEQVFLACIQWRTLRPSIVTCVLQSCALDGDVDRAERILSRAHRALCVSDTSFTCFWLTCVMKAYINAGRSEEGFGVLQRIEDGGAQADETCMTVAIKACGHAAEMCLIAGDP
eukprot:Hpha_TRINITY_DN11000_c0_g1::TRINITY_DN11000_c0_g1_i1::g.93053::m.93053